MQSPLASRAQALRLVKWGSRHDFVLKACCQRLRLAIRLSAQNHGGPSFSCKTPQKGATDWAPPSVAPLFGGFACLTLRPSSQTAELWVGAELHPTLSCLGAGSEGQGDKQFQRCPRKEGLTLLIVIFLLLSFAQDYRKCLAASLDPFSVGHLGIGYHCDVNPKPVCTLTSTLPWATEGPEASSFPWYPPSFAWWGIMWSLGSGSSACSCVCAWVCAQFWDSLSLRMRYVCACEGLQPKGFCPRVHILAHACARTCKANNSAVGVFTPYFGLRPNGVNPQSTIICHLKGVSPLKPPKIRTEMEQSFALGSSISYFELDFKSL